VHSFEYGVALARLDGCTITPSGDSPCPPEIAESLRLASLVLWRESMLEWKPRLIVLVVGLAALASSMGFVFDPVNFGWGAW
jgi:hypothetical protein